MKESFDSPLLAAASLNSSELFLSMNLRTKDVFTLHSFSILSAINHRIQAVKDNSAFPFIPKIIQLCLLNEGISSTLKNKQVINISNAY